MQKIEFGSTGLVIEKNGFGCLPIQRISETEAVKLLHKACDGGINFFDTARAYSDSEQKVGAAFSGMRDRIVLATKTGVQLGDAAQAFFDYVTSADANEIIVAAGVVPAK